jgi:hypothetical protein
VRAAESCILDMMKGCNIVAAACAGGSLSQASCAHLGDILDQDVALTHDVSLRSREGCELLGVDRSVMFSK